MEEQLEQVVYSTKYALLDLDTYNSLNHSISEALGFDLGLPTERYAPIEPMLAKVNIAYDEEGNQHYDTMPIMQITNYVQECLPELLIGITLQDSYEPFIALEN